MTGRGLQVHRHDLMDGQGAEVNHTFIAPADGASGGILLNEL